MLELAATLLLTMFASVGLYQIIAALWTIYEAKHLGVATVTNRDTYICMFVTITIIFLLLSVIR